jgi:hypothetical protein
MVTRPMWKEMMSVKTMMETYVRKHQTTQTSTSDNLWAQIAVLSVDWLSPFNSYGI